MNDKLDEQLAKVIEKSLSLAEKTGEFVIDQAPELLREFYAWHIAENIFGIVVSIISIIAIYQLRRLVSKKEETDYYSTKLMGRYFETDELPFILYSVLGCLGITWALFALFSCAFDLVKIIVAPKIYLIEYFL